MIRLSVILLQCQTCSSCRQDFLENSVLHSGISSLEGPIASEINLSDELNMGAASLKKVLLEPHGSPITKQSLIVP